MTNSVGFLIQFDEEQRTSFLSEVGALRDGFSDALSSADWSIKQWEVCGLLFEPEIITHWALAHKTRRVATGKVRVELTCLAGASAIKCWWLPRNPLAC